MRAARLLVLSCLLFVLAACGGDGGPPPAAGPDPAGGRVITSNLRAVAVRESYTIQVFVPADYDAGTALLPAIYVTEGDAPYGAGATGPGFGPGSRFDAFKQAMQRRKTRALLVGIGGTARRNTDFLLPTARDYLDFITKELAPQIERDYRADPKRRALSGLSHGGYFVLAALVMEGTSGTFNFSHYLSNDTSFGTHAGQPGLLEYERQLDGRPLPVTLLLAGAAPDGTTNGRMVRAVYEQMLGHAHPGLTLHHSSFNTTHVGADLPAFEDALVRYFPSQP